MRPLILFLAVAFVTESSVSRSAPVQRLRAPQIAGREYIRLNDWARSHEFQVRWVKRDETLQIGNQSTRIALTVDSQEAEINGVQVRLLFPLVLRDGQPCITQNDLRTTLEPIVSAARARSSGTIKNICLDPGHGGKDPGYRIGFKQEKKYNLLLAEEVQTQLGKAGFKVSMTRTSDNFIELSDRPEIAKRRNADLFVSLHFNAAPQPSVRGTEVYCLTPAGAPSTNARGEGGGSGSCPGNRLNSQNMLLAYQLQKSLTRSLGTEDRGVHRARFAVLRDASVPAALIEGGFMSHPIEGRKIFDPAYRREMARAIVEGIIAYKRQVESPT